MRAIAALLAFLALPAWASVTCANRTGTCDAVQQLCSGTNTVCADATYTCTQLCQSEGLLAHWHMSEASGTRSDSVDSLDMTEVYGTNGVCDTLFTPSPIIGGAQTDGANEYNLTIDSSALEAAIPTGSSWTMCGWVFSASAGSYISTSNGRMKFGAGGSTTEAVCKVENNAVDVSGATFDIRDWTFFCLVYDAAAQTGTCQINGQSDFTAASVTPVGTAAALFLTDPAAPVDMCGAEFSLYGVALPRASRDALYNSGAYAEPPELP